MVFLLLKLTDGDKEKICRTVYISMCPRSDSFDFSICRFFLYLLNHDYFNTCDRYSSKRGDCHVCLYIILSIF